MHLFRLSPSIFTQFHMISLLSHFFFFSPLFLFYFPCSSSVGCCFCSHSRLNAKIISPNRRLMWFKQTQTIEKKVAQKIRGSPRYSDFIHWNRATITIKMVLQTHCHSEGEPLRRSARRRKNHHRRLIFTIVVFIIVHHMENAYLHFSCICNRFFQLLCSSQFLDLIRFWIYLKFIESKCKKVIILLFAWLWTPTIGGTQWDVISALTKQNYWNKTKTKIYENSIYCMLWKTAYANKNYIEDFFLKQKKTV